MVWTYSFFESLNDRSPARRTKDSRGLIFRAKTEKVTFKKLSQDSDRNALKFFIRSRQQLIKPIDWPIVNLSFFAPLL
jgi:hypothetical protein